MVISQHELKSKRGVYEHIEAIKASLLSLLLDQCTHF